MTTAAHHIQHILRHLEAIRADQCEFDIIVDQEFGQAMDRASIFEIAHHCDAQAIDPIQFITNGKEIKQRLRWMFTHPVAGINNRLLGIMGRRCRRARFRMAQDDHIGVTFQRAYGIGQTFAFSHRAILHIVDRNHLATQAQHGRHKAGAGTGTWLVEEIGQDFALQQVSAAKALDQHLHFVRHPKNIIKVGAIKLAHTENVLPKKAIVHMVSRQTAAGAGRWASRHHFILFLFVFGFSLLLS